MIEVHAVFVPTAFSPNGDGVNETFRIYGSGIRSYTLNVYDRWGEAVFAGSGAAPAWDGTLNGRILGKDNYIFVAVINYWNGDRERRIGDITLLR